MFAFQEWRPGVVVAALTGFCLMSHAFADPPAMYESAQVTRPVVALTFDDGPTPDLTPRLLDILREQGVKATLFVIGKRAAGHPELIKRAAAEGHEIGNHTWTHQNIPQLTREEALAEIQQTTDILAQILGRKPALYRPPYLATTDELNRWVRDELGMKVISANVDSKDWRDRNADMARDAVLAQAAPGAIILCHETQPTTLDALPEIIRGLKAKGYEFVTVSELLAPANP